MDFDTADNHCQLADWSTWKGTKEQLELKWFTPATMPKQHCRMLSSTTMSNKFFVKFRPFDNIETNRIWLLCVAKLIIIIIGSKMLEEPIIKNTLWYERTAFTRSYNSTESEPIWIKSGKVWAKCWGLAVANFGRDPHSSDSLRGSRNFVFFCPVYSARFRRFPVGKKLRHFNTTASIGEAVKIFGSEFWKFYRKGSFFQKTQKLLTQFPGFATSGYYNFARITDRRTFTSKWSLFWMSSFHFYR